MDDQVFSSEDVFLSDREESSTSFKRFVSRYEREVYSLAFYLCGNAAAAEETLTKVFASFCHNRLPLPAIAGDFRYNLFAETVKVVTDLLKLRTFTAPILQKENYSLSHEESPRISVAGLEKSIQRLPLDYRKVFVLRDILGVKVEAVSEIVAISVTQVRAQLQRARLMIRRGFLTEAEEVDEETNMDVSLAENHQPVHSL